MITGDQWVFHDLPEPIPVITMTPLPENSVVLSCGSEEMLRVAQDGFYIRGVKIDQDDKEAEQVYNCFNGWLTWSTMNRV